MGRFLCALLIGGWIALGVTAWFEPAQEPAQSVFFSLLFPQLMPEREMDVEPEEEDDVFWLPLDQLRWKAVFL